jgi:hypothetical protein
MKVTSIYIQSILVGNPEGQKDQFEDLGVDGRILKWTLKKWGVKLWINSFWLRIGTSSGFL